MSQEIENYSRWLISRFNSPLGNDINEWNLGGQNIQGAKNYLADGFNDSPVFGITDAGKKVLFGAVDPNGLNIEGGYIQFFGNGNIGSYYTPNGGSELIIDSRNNGTKFNIINYNNSLNLIWSVDSNGLVTLADGVTMGNNGYNGPTQLVLLDSVGALPALDGINLTGVTVELNHIIGLGSSVPDALSFGVGAGNGLARYDGDGSLLIPNGGVLYFPNAAKVGAGALTDTSGQTSIDWVNREMIEPTGTATIDWNQCFLRDTGNTLILRWIPDSSNIAGAVYWFDSANNNRLTGDGGGFVNLNAGNLTGALPAIDGSLLINLPIALGSRWTNNDTNLYFNDATPASTTQIWVSDVDSQGNSGWQNAFLGLPPAVRMLEISGVSGVSAFRVDRISDAGGGFVQLDVAFWGGCNVSWGSGDYRIPLPWEKNKLVKDLGVISGGVTLDVKQGRIQKFWINNDTVIGINSDGIEDGDEFVIIMSFSSGNFQFGFDGSVNSSQWESFVFPYTTTPWRSLRVAVGRQGGLWTINNVTEGPENED